GAQLPYTGRRDDHRRVGADLFVARLEQDVVVRFADVVADRDRAAGDRVDAAFQEGADRHRRAADAVEAGGERNLRLIDAGIGPGECDVIDAGEDRIGGRADAGAEDVG